MTLKIKLCLIIINCLIHILCAKETLHYDQIKNHDITFTLIYADYEYHSITQRLNFNFLKDYYYSNEIFFLTSQYLNGLEIKNIDIIEIPSYLLNFGTYHTIIYKGAQSKKSLSIFLKSTLFPFFNIYSKRDIIALYNNHQYSLIYNCLDVCAYEHFLFNVISYHAQGNLQSTIGFGFNQNSKLYRDINNNLTSFYVFYNSYSMQEMVFTIGDDFELAKWLEQNTDMKIYNLKEIDLEKHNIYEKGNETSIILVTNTSQEMYLDFPYLMFNSMHHLYLDAFETTTSIQSKNTTRQHSAVKSLSNFLGHFNESLSQCLALREQYKGLCTKNHRLNNPFQTNSNSDKQSVNLEYWFVRLKQENKQILEPIPHQYNCPSKDLSQPLTTLAQTISLMPDLLNLALQQICENPTKFHENLRKNLYLNSSSEKCLTPNIETAIMFCNKMFDFYNTHNIQNQCNTTQSLCPSAIFSLWDFNQFNEISAMYIQALQTNPISTENKTHLKFKVLDTDLLQNEYRYFMGIPDLPTFLGNTPALFIVDEHTKTKYYLPNSRFNPIEIANFIAQYINGTLPRLLLVENIPQTSHSNEALSKSAIISTKHSTSTQNAILDLNSATFESIAFDQTKDVVVMFYAHYCGFCLSVNNLYLLLAQENSRKNTLFSRIDCANNDLTTRHKVKYYPTLKIYPAYSNETQTYPASSPWTLEDLANWIDLQIATNRWKMANVLLRNIVTHYGDANAETLILSQNQLLQPKISNAQSQGRAYFLTNLIKYYYHMSQVNYNNNVLHHLQINHGFRSNDKQLPIAV